MVKIYCYSFKKYIRIFSYFYKGAIKKMFCISWSFLLLTEKLKFMVLVKG